MSRTRPLAVATGLAVAVLGLALPARPAAAADTTTTFAILAGTLAITAPATANLGSLPTGSTTLSASLGAVTVSDTRGPLLGAWTASVTSTAFKTGAGTANETISNANIAYASGNATATAGVGVFTPGQATVAQAQSLTVSRTAYSATVLVGNNSATWNPTIVVTIPAAAVAGTYTATITHSVA